MQRFRVAMILLSCTCSLVGQEFEPNSTNCIETAPQGLWSPWVVFDETEFYGQWFVADGPLGGSCSSGGGFFEAGALMQSGVPVDLRGLGAGQRFITAIVKRHDDSIRPIRMVWNVEITTPGDVNGDGIVGFDDFIAISRAYGDEVGREHGDIDYSGDVNFGDFIILSRNYGAGLGLPEEDIGSQFVASSFSFTPEPSAQSQVLVAFVLSLLVMRNTSFLKTARRGH